MSVENKIRELLNQRLGEAFPGMGKNKEEAAPMQGSSEKPEMEVLEKGSKAASVKSSAPLAAGVGAKENEPMMQGSSQKATIDSEDDEDTQGKTQASKAKKQPEVKGQGAGEAPNFTTHADPTSVVSQSSNAGNVHKEEVDTEEYSDENVTVEHFNNEYDNILDINNDSLVVNNNFNSGVNNEVNTSLVDNSSSLNSDNLPNIKLVDNKNSFDKMLVYGSFGSLILLVIILIVIYLKRIKL